jgi:hypothetical protein
LAAVIWMRVLNWTQGGGTGDQNKKKLQDCHLKQTNWISQPFSIRRPRNAKKFSNFAMHNSNVCESQSAEFDEFHTCDLPVAAICERDHGGSQRKTKREQQIHVATNLFPPKLSRKRRSQRAKFASKLFLQFFLNPCSVSDFLPRA